jgi:YesN/AraC family two-component response regulator
MSHTILIADDSIFIREALCGLFEREEDFDVCGEAENGKEAVEKAQELHPDLILLDLSMPVMNGLDATRDDARSADHHVQRAQRFFHREGSSFRRRIGASLKI